MSDRYLYLNLQEQVGKNKNDIEEIRRQQSSLVNARVIGTEASDEDLPDPETYGGQPGDGYLVGTGEPYNLYIFSEPSAGEVGFKWVNVGQYPAPGPKGEEGPQGPQGPQGDASNWRFGTTNPSVLDTDNMHDGYLNTSTGMVYEFDGSLWIPIGSIKGAQGPQGPQGPVGPIGPEGAPGIQGERGPAGMTVVVKDTVASVGALPDPEDVDRNDAYIVDDGNDKDLYIIIGEDGSRSWYNAGAFAGTPGEAAGFGVVDATITALPPSSSPSVNVETDGPDNEKNFTFNFGIPVGADLENANAAPGSTVKGYTQKVINDRSFNKIYKSVGQIGLSANAKISDVISNMATNTETAIYTGNGAIRIDDLPRNGLSVVNGLLHIIKENSGRYSVTLCGTDYNVYLYYGSAGTPSVAIWRRLVTLGSGDSTNVPSGGTTGQMLAKESDLDYDTTWTDAPTGVPDGGTTDQILAKKSDADGDVEWQTPAPGIPSGGASGQVLAKTSNSDYAVTWITPEEGGGGDPAFIRLSGNKFINPYFYINQRGSVGWGVGVAGYTVDRWYKYSAGTVDRVVWTHGEGAKLNLVQSKVCQFVQAPAETSQTNDFLVMVLFNIDETNHTLSANPIYANARYVAGGTTTSYAMQVIDRGRISGKGGDSANFSQYYAVFTLPFEQSDYWEIGVDLTGEDQGNNAVGIQRAGCYMIYDWNRDLKDLLFGASGKGISVAMPNYASELGKCKYYYERTGANTSFTSITITASGNIKTINSRVGFEEKRVTPTLQGTGITVRYVNTSFTFGSATGTATALSRLDIRINASVENAIWGGISPTDIDLKIDAEIYP